MINPSKYTILCVDDEPVNLALLERILIPRNFEIVRAQNGVEALERIIEHKIDLVLLDVMMPKMNGYETCKKLKADERHRHIPVIMITALKSKDDRIKSIDAGAEDFISKPFEQAEVLARIDMLLHIRDLTNPASKESNNRV